MHDNYNDLGGSGSGLIEMLYPLLQAKPSLSEHFLVVNYQKQNISYISFVHEIFLSSSNDCMIFHSHYRHTAPNMSKPLHLFAYFSYQRDKFLTVICLVCQQDVALRTALTRTHPHTTWHLFLYQMQTRRALSICVSCSQKEHKNIAQWEVVSLGPNDLSTKPLNDFHENV